MRPRRCGRPKGQLGCCPFRSRGARAGRRICRSSGGLAEEGLWVDMQVFPLLIRGLAPPTARCWPAPACSRIQGDDLPFPTPVRSILTSPAILLRPGFLSDCGAAQRSDPGFWMNAADSLQGTRIILVLNRAGEHLLMCLLSRMPLQVP